MIGDKMKITLNLVIMASVYFIAVSAVANEIKQDQARGINRDGNVSNHEAIFSCMKARSMADAIQFDDKMYMSSEAIKEKNQKINCR
jgi:hypothetical protein